MKKLILLNIFLLSGIVLFAQNGFTNYPYTITGPNHRTSIKIDLAGNKWIGTNGTSTFSKGVYKFDGVNWSVYNTTNSSIASNIVNDITFDVSNKAWFATTSGVSKFDGNTWTTYNSSNSGLPNDTVNCIFSQGQWGNIWIGTNNGLARYNGFTWIVYNTSNSGLINNKVTAVKVDSNGDVWVGTQTGLSIKKASGWVSYDGNNSNFISGKVTSIYVENSTTKWVATGGSNIFKFENDKIIPLSSLIKGTEMISWQNVITISKGPQGGVLFNGNNGYQNPNGFYELVGTSIYFYTFPAGYSSYIHAFENSSNKVWFVSMIGGNPSSFISSFDYSAFTGTINIQKNANEEMLDVNQVRAAIMNRGDLHRANYQAGYEVPKSSGRNAIYSSSLWIGGLDAGVNLHQAAMTYRQSGFDYFPGPLDTLTGNIDSTTSSAYDKIWKLDRWQIDEFRTMFANGSVTSGAYIPADNIVNWPAQGTGYYTRNMAPFVDVNGDGIYNPLVDGDYPKIKGDQMCYWIFNDNLKPHTETGAAALKVEVHASAYEYNCDSIADSLKALNYTTFYDYEIYNRGNSNYSQTYLSLWQDYDLGGYNDDYTGCNPSENYSFVCNGDSLDEGLGGVLGYGTNPPMYSNVILNGPPAVPNDGIDNNNNGIVDEAGEKNLMTHVLNYNNNTNPVNGNPNTAMDFYNYMQGKWRDSTQITYGSDGVGPGTPYNFMFDGVPTLAGWSEATLNNPFVDRRINMSCGPFNLDAASHVNFNFVIVYTRDDQPTYDIVHLYNKNLNDIHKIKQWYAADNFPSCDPAVTIGIANHVEVTNNLSLYPNPSSDIIYIDYKTQSKNSTIVIYDVKGQIVKQMKLENQSRQAVNISSFTSGLYLMVVTDGKNVDTQRFIKQ